MTDSSNSPRLSWFDARVGDRMIEALRIVNENGPYASMTEVAKDVYAEEPHRHTNTPIVRCLNRGLLKRDRNHELRGHKSQGAILITEDGRRLLRMYGHLDTADSETEADTPE